MQGGGRAILEDLSGIGQMNSSLAEFLSHFGHIEAGFVAYLQKKRSVFPRLNSVKEEDASDSTT